MLARPHKDYDRYTIHTLGFAKAAAYMRDFDNKYQDENIKNIPSEEYLLYGLCSEYYQEKFAGNSHLYNYLSTVQPKTISHIHASCLLAPVPFARYFETPATSEYEDALEYLSHLSELDIVPPSSKLMRAYLMTCLGADNLTQTKLSIAEGNLNMAKVLQETLTDEFPYVKLDLAITCYYLAEIFLRKNDFANAGKYADAALQHINDFNATSGVIHHFIFHIQFMRAQVFFANKEMQAALLVSEKMVEDIEAFEFQINLIESLALRSIYLLTHPQAGAQNALMRAYNLQMSLLPPDNHVLLQTKYNVISLFDQNLKINWNDYTSYNESKPLGMQLATFIQNEKAFALTNLKETNFSLLCYKWAIYLTHYCEDKSNADELYKLSLAQVKEQHSRLWIKSHTALFFMGRLKEYNQNSNISSAVKNDLFEKLIAHCNHVILLYEKELEEEANGLGAKSLLLLAFNYYLKTYTLFLVGFHADAKKMCIANLAFCEKFKLDGDISLKMLEQHALMLAADEDVAAKEIYKKLSASFSMRLLPSLQQAEFHMNYAAYLKVNGKWKQACEQYAKAIDIGVLVNAPRLCGNAKSEIQILEDIMSKNAGMRRCEVSLSAPLSSMWYKKKPWEEKNSAIVLERSLTM
jgi:hypothetical protein